MDLDTQTEDSFQEEVDTLVSRVSSVSCDGNVLGWHFAVKFAHRPEISDLRTSISDCVRRFCASTGGAVPFVRAQPRLLDMNAAVELAKRDYDLAVGVVRGGVAVPILMSFLGQRITFLQNNRESSKTNWFSARPEFKRPAQADNVLLCEDDALTGGTLRRARPKMADLNPSRVDVCFRQDIPEQTPSRVVAEGLGTYDRVFYTSSVSFSNFLTNLGQLEKAAREATQGMRQYQRFY